MASSTIKQIIKFTSILLLFLFVTLLCDRGIGAIMKLLYFRQESGDGYLLTYTIDSTTADIIVLGSSRAKHSYVPEIFESNLNLTCFNAGRDGTEHVLISYAQFKAVTARYNPTIVIFDIRPEDLGYRAKEYDLLSPLLPYYYIHSEIKEIIDVRGPFEKIKHISAIYPYNSLIFQVIMGNLDLNKERNLTKKVIFLSMKRLLLEKLIH